MSIDKSRMKADIFIAMVVIVMVIGMCTAAKSQKSFVGAGIGPTNAVPYVTTLQELDAAFARLSLVSHINTTDPHFRVRFGLAAWGNKPVHAVFYVPQMNLSLKRGMYNTPFGAEVRFVPGGKGEYLLVLGTDYFLKDYFGPYFQAYVKFK